MAEIHPERLLTTFAIMTEQREQISLEISLMAAIRESVSPREIHFYHLQHTLEGRALSPAYGSDHDAPEYGVPVALEHCPEFKACLESDLNVMTFPSKRKSGVREIYKIHGLRDVVAFLELDCRNDSARRKKLVSTLLDIFHNVISLIYDNERDTLTGLLNRKTFDQKISKLITEVNSEKHRAVDIKNPLSHVLAIMDIDHFKRINDNFGHLYGDEVLLLMSGLMQQAFRDGDLLFRFGGEEFVAVMKNTDLEKARLVVERFRSRVEQFNFPQVGKVTVSSGFTQVIKADMAASIIDRADQALYFSKENGRNQSWAYENLIAEGKLVQKTITEGEIEFF